MQILLVKNDITSLFSEAMLSQNVIAKYTEPKDINWMLRETEYDALVFSAYKGVDNAGSIIKYLRFKKVDIPIMMLSNEYTTEKCASMLNAGADACINLHETSSAEIIATFNAIVRRAKKEILTTKIKFHGFVLDIIMQTITYKGKEIRFTVKEYTLLKILIMNSNKIYSNNVLLNQMYNALLEDLPSVKIIDVFVCKIRKKITAACGDKELAFKIITTKWGSGYTGNK